MIRTLLRRLLPYRQPTRDADHCDRCAQLITDLNYLDVGALTERRAHIRGQLAREAAATKRALSAHIAEHHPGGDTP